MTAIAFDTLAFSKRLQSAGMSQEQAEALTSAQSEAIKEIVAAQELVTKKDLYVALSETKHEILKWVMGLLVAQTALIVAAMALVK